MKINSKIKRDLLSAFFIATFTTIINASIEAADSSSSFLSELSADWLGFVFMFAVMYFVFRWIQPDIIKEGQYNK